MKTICKDIASIILITAGVLAAIYIFSSCNTVKKASLNNDERYNKYSISLGDAVDSADEAWINHFSFNGTNDFTKHQLTGFLLGSNMTDSGRSEILSIRDIEGFHRASMHYDNDSSGIEDKYFFNNNDDSPLQEYIDSLYTSRVIIEGGFSSTYIEGPIQELNKADFKRTDSTVEFNPFYSQVKGEAVIPKKETQRIPVAGIITLGIVMASIMIAYKYRFAFFEWLKNKV